MKSSMRARLLCGLALAFVFGAAKPAAATPLKIGYSDWPGWVAWQVAIDKGWFKQAGVDVDFEWFDYSASIDAFSAGKLDADFVTNGDALVTAGSGTKNLMVMVTDYSDGNDVIVAKPGIKTLKDLKGQKVGLEVGLVENLLLLDGLKKAGMTDQDVQIVNVKTNETPQVLASGQVSAIGAWQPNAGEAMKALPGSRGVYTSAQSPGLIYDVLAVSPSSLAAHKAEYAKLFKVWDRVVAYINDPKTQPDALKIMSARDGLTPAEYKKFLKGTRLLTVADGKKVFVKGPGLGSLYGSSVNADQFNVKYNVYKTSLDVSSYIDPSLIDAQ
jgi:NitT/TauT family transport system substrate-binding protein